MRALGLLLVLWLLVGAVSVSADDAGPDVPSGGAAAEIDSGSESVGAVLRQIGASIDDEQDLEALEATIEQDTAATAAGWSQLVAVVGGTPRRSTLMEVSATWQRLRAQLETLAASVRGRLRAREGNLETLTRLHDAWTKALALAQGAGEPQPVLDRAQATIAAVDAMRQRVEQRRYRVLMRLDQITRATQTCDDALARLEEARRESVARLAVRNVPPLWRAGAPSDDVAQAGTGLSDDVAAIAAYVRQDPAGVGMTAAVILAVAVVLRRGPGPVASRLSPMAMEVFRAPWSAAVLLGLGVTTPLRPYPPVAFQYLLMIVAVVAAIRFLHRWVQGPFTPVAWATAALLAFDLLRALVDLPPRPDQLALTFELSAAAGLLFHAARLVRRASGPHAGGLARLLEVVAFGAAVNAAAAFLGWQQLADFVGSGLFDLACMVFAVMGFRTAGYSLLALAIAVGPLARVRAVAHHRALVEQRLRGIVDLVTAAILLTAFLRRFELVDAAGAAFDAMLAARLQVGELDLALGQVVGFFVVVTASFLTARLVVFFLEEDVFPRMALPRGVPYALATLTRYGMLLAGFLLGLATLGFDLTRVTVLLSAFGVGIGFGLQEIVNNFVSGLILIFERPIQVGDSLQLGDMTGDVLRIGIRSSTLRTGQGAEVIIPNSKLLDDKVTNWTLSDRRRRIDLDVGIGWDADARELMALMVDVAKRDPRVHATPPPEALLLRFGDASADFQLRVWTDDPHFTRMQSDLEVALQAALRERRLAAAAVDA